MSQDEDESPISLVLKHIYLPHVYPTCRVPYGDTTSVDRAQKNLKHENLILNRQPTPFLQEGVEFAGNNQGLLNRFLDMIGIREIPANKHARESYRRIQR